jgi:hypothetical protein
MAMSMRERIAKAILKDLSDRRGIRHALECVDDDVMQEIREALADAVLSELLTPTEGMVEAATLSIIDAPDPIDYPLVASGFTAAIQAAKEGK